MSPTAAGLYLLDDGIWKKRRLILPDGAMGYFYPMQP